ncbi:glutathione S-transferase family protein [Rhodopila sp.]|uniref:glutathione S-transferase family protein n=1 Tax=Rhodopila sp. TaxID=2480087 RepID=UPI003D1211DD
MSDYKLHYFPESGNSYKLALMLTLCGQAFEPVWTDFGSGITWTEGWRRSVNPMGEIPVLVEDGVSLTQTAPILLRLADKFGRFQGTDETERFEILRWLFWDNQKLSGFMAAYRYRRAFTENPDRHVLDFMKARTDDFLNILESSLKEQRFIVGDKPTVADLSMTGYLAFPKHESGYDLDASHPAIGAWLGRIRALPSWAAPYDILPGKRMRCYV